MTVLAMPRQQKINQGYEKREKMAFFHSVEEINISYILLQTFRTKLTYLFREKHTNFI